MTNLIEIEIINKSSLLAACDILHDAYFDLSKMRFNRTKRTWSGLFQREFFEDDILNKREKRLLFFTKYSYQLCDCTLELSNVSNCKYIDKSNIGIYMFNECIANNDTYKFQFCEDLEIAITFSEIPKGKLKYIQLRSK
jgi:hypothetical protein